MVLGDKGTMFMGTRLIGRVYAVTDKDGKREAKVLLQGPDPAERPRLQERRALRARDRPRAALRQHRGQARQPRRSGRPDRQVQPSAGHVHHNWKYAAFGPDDKLYIQVGANCNICEINPGIHGQIRRYNADGSGMEIVARGVRNTVGFDWHPVTKELWFTDNGRDWAGNAGPEDELNRVAKGQEGAYFGFPYCHANGVPDPDIKKPNPCAGVTLPAALTGPHAGGARHQVLHRQHVPRGLPRTALHRPARLVEPGPEVRLRRCGRRGPAGGKATLTPFLTGFLDEAKNEF